jgi:predicted Rossmann-fold nucleotide-binding protein
MKILVCGGRNYDDYEAVVKTLSWLGPDLIIHGGAPGADSLAAEYARETKTPVKAFLADWQTHGRAAGPLRNQQMLDEGKPDLVVAFPGGIGTADMVRRAEAAGVKVQEVTP